MIIIVSYILRTQVFIVFYALLPCDEEYGEQRFSEQ